MLLYPGDQSPPTDVQAVLAERHEEIRAARARAIEERKANNVPLDDGIDWSKVKLDKASEAVINRDSAALRVAAQDLLSATADMLTPIGPYEPIARLVGVLAVFVVLSERERRRLASQEEAAYRALRRVVLADDTAGVSHATDALFDVRRAYVTAAVARVDVPDEPCIEAMDDRALDVLERNGLLAPLAVAAAAHQELSPGKASRSGSSAAPTLSASTAPTARSTDVAPVAVMGDAWTSKASPRSMPALDGRPTPARGGT